MRPILYKKVPKSLVDSVDSGSTRSIELYHKRCRDQPSMTDCQQEEGG